MRTAKEIENRCKPILDQPKIVSLVEQSSSPTAAYDMVMTETNNSETAKAARWLAVLRRDHTDHYSALMQRILRQVPKGTAQKGRGHEEAVRL